MDISTFFVAGAAAFCAQTPDHPACQPQAPFASIETVALTDDRARLLESVAQRMHSDPSAKTAPELFKAIAEAASDFRGDCTPEALWALEQLAQDPELLAATRMVLYFQGDTEAAHTVLLTWTHAQAVIIDSRDGRVQPFTHTQMIERLPKLYVAADGLAGKWKPILASAD